VVADDEPAGSSRRKLLGAAAASIAGAGLVSACGHSSRLHVGNISPTAGETDLVYLNHALALKQYSVAAYTAATPLLRGREHLMGKRFLGQELSHASQIMSLIKHAGGTPNPAPSTYNFGHPRGSRGILELLYTAENAIIAGYLKLLPDVSPGVVRAELCAIFANDAQHVSVLRLGLRRDPIPDAFVTGHE
jgi:Ferritin-like domain